MPTCFGSPIWRIDQITSSAVNGEPSCHLTPGRSLISYFVAVAFGVHESASPGDCEKSGLTRTSGS